MKNYCLVLTYKCNWYCEYCSIDTHNNKKEKKFDQILKEIDQIEPYSDVTLSGGETGLVSKNKLDIIFNLLEKKYCEININTNGLFMEKYYNIYYDRVTDFYFHVSENLDNAFIRYNDPDKKIRYLIVVVDNNMKNLDSFLNKNNDVKFTIYGGDSHMRSNLKKINGLKIWQKYKDIIDPESFKYLMNNCSLSNPTLQIIL